MKRALISLAILVTAGCGSGGDGSPTDIDGHWSGNQEGYSGAGTYGAQFIVRDHALSTIEFHILASAGCQSGTSSAYGLDLAEPVPVIGSAALAVDADDPYLSIAITFTSNTKAFWTANHTLRSCAITASGHAVRDSPITE